MIFLIVLFVWPLLVGKLMDSFELLQNALADNDPNDELAQFFGMLEHFNRNHPLNKDLINSIEEYFKAYWQDNKLMLIQGDKNEQHFI